MLSRVARRARTGADSRARSEHVGADLVAEADGKGIRQPLRWMSQANGAIAEVFLQPDLQSVAKRAQPRCVIMLHGQLAGRAKSDNQRHRLRSGATSFLMPGPMM